MTEGNNCEMKGNTAGVTEIVEEEKGKGRRLVLQATSHAMQTENGQSTPHLYPNQSHYTWS